MNKTPITLIMCMLLISLTTACNQTTDGNMNMKKSVTALKNNDFKDYSGLLDTAKSNLAKAKNIGGEWRDSGKTLKKALSKAKDGDYIGALMLLKMVNFQAKRGYRQSISQKNIGNPDYLY